MKKFLFILFFLTTTFGVGHLAFAQQQYNLLAPVPLSGAASTPSASVDINNIAANYLPGIVQLIIGIAGALAVIMIMIGGIEYITSATGMGKSNGKDRIFNAVIGFVLVIGAYTILNTINPSLVKLDFSHLVPVKPSSALITSGGTVTSVTPCPNCISVSSTVVPQKPPGQGCLLATYGNPYDNQCTMNTTISSELVNLANKFGTSGWQVTEMYPTTVPHISACHDAGTCVDAALSANPSDTTILAFINAVKAAGFSSYVYEACDNVQGFTTARLTQLTSDPILRGLNIQCEPTTQGENIHLNQ